MTVMYGSTAVTNHGRTSALAVTLEMVRVIPITGDS
jgi:hypothetical protein